LVGLKKRLNLAFVLICVRASIALVRTSAFLQPFFRYRHPWYCLPMVYIRSISHYLDSLTHVTITRRRSLPPPTMMDVTVKTLDGQNRSFSVPENVG